MKGLLVRTDSIDIAPMDFEIRRHVNRDSGCRTNAANFLRPYLRAYHYALVIFDRHGCGSRGTREEIQEEVEIDLTRNGWEGRSKAIVIDPELEVWVWSRSPIVAEVLGWDTDFEALDDGWNRRICGLLIDVNRRTRRTRCGGQWKRRDSRRRPGGLRASFTISRQRRISLIVTTRPSSTSRERYAPGSRRRQNDDQDASPASLARSRSLGCDSSSALTAAERRTR